MYWIFVFTYTHKTFCLTDLLKLMFSSIIWQMCYYYALRIASLLFSDQASATCIKISELSQNNPKYEPETVFDPKVVSDLYFG